MANKPDGIGATNTTPGSCVDVPCKPNLTVIYRIRSSCGSIPFALEVNGKVPDDFTDRALGVKCDGKSEIRRPAKPGDRFGLYLNSDAHPDYRNQKVYAVTVGSNDVVMTITEKSGKHLDSDTPTLTEMKTIKNAKGEERQTDFYTAPLTGDIWLKISHKYATSDIDAILPTSTDKTVSTAIKTLYDGSLNKANRTITVARAKQGDLPAKQIKIHVGEGSDKNPLENIQNFDLFKDGLPRVHPLGYLALIDAAFDAGVDNVTMSSTWRPLLGKAWNHERNKNEPEKVKGYRASLARCTHVRQIFDPWFMDADSQDNEVATPNEQRDANEKLHATHLHITVDEPKLIKKS